MTFEEKRDAVDEARLQSLELDEYFKELLGSGLSSVGAYNSCYEKIAPKKPTAIAPVQKPVSTNTKTSAVNSKVEKENGKSSKLK
jgi:hypothetical protein